ncbi:MAG: acetolactate synthase small subunit [Lentisphaeria bacterium]|nr:acetolactate synthase small subunit [Lentisphaeria bacterium]
MKHTISVLVQNRFGVLARIAGLFSGRGYNIDSLNVSPTQDETVSRMTILTHGDDAVLEQIEKQLNKLVEVMKVTDLTGSGFVSRELMLIKVRADAATRNDIIQITSIFKANVVNVEHDSLMVEVTGPTEKLDAFVSLMAGFGIVETARTGRVALVRSSQPTEMLDQPCDATRNSGGGGDAGDAAPA